MSSTRRQFLDQLAVSAAAVGSLPLALGAFAAPAGAERAPGAAEWDVTWVRRITGKHRAVFDVPEIESGYGVWRASLWSNQYQQVLGIPAKDISPVVVLRHNGIALAMRQDFWDRHGIGKSKSVTHPISSEPTDRNPALLADAPAPFNELTLERFIARGGVALACDLALQECARLIEKAEGVSGETAHARAVAMLVPGVILQPSGVFAVVRAQEAGCNYVRAS